MILRSEVEKHIPDTGRRYDVVVAGGGPAGLGAALAARRMGAEVLLLEARSFFGGVAATSLFMPVNRLKTGGKTRGGVHEMLVNKLESYGGLACREGKVTWTDGDGLHVHPDYLKEAIFQLLEENGADYRLYSPVCGAKVENGTVKQAIVSTKDGQAAFEAEVFIDCTGDGDLAYHAGAKIEVGRETDGALMPVTLGFALSNVDTKRLFEFYDRDDQEHKMPAFVARAKVLGYSVAPWYSFDRTTVPNMVTVNNGGLKDIGTLNTLLARDATVAERVGIRIAVDFVRWARELKIPGLEDCFLDRTGAAVGVRETRRVICDYVLSMEDAANGAQFTDVIARRYGAVDLAGLSANESTKMKSGYDYPYRALLPVGLNGLLVAGRCGSYTHLALAAGKSMGNMMAIGQAAGVAAALSAKEKVTPRELPAAKVQKALLETLNARL
jgi:hypothetical protein